MRGSYYFQYGKMRFLFKYGFYSLAASIQMRLLFKKIRLIHLKTYIFEINEDSKGSRKSKDT